MGLIRVLLLVAWLACGSFAAEAKIVGPAEGKPGDLVVISAHESVGKAFKWVMPSEIQTLSCSDLEFGFATGSPGVYTFVLIAADTDDAAKPIDVAMHTITIKGTVPTPPTDPEEPEAPTPGDFDALRKISRDAATALSDDATAKGLADTIQAQADEIKRMCEQQQCPTLATAKQMMVISIERRLLMRTGNSRNVNWADGWRKPVNDFLQTANANTLESYLLAMRAAAVGLSES